jgi:putative transposase
MAERYLLTVVRYIKLNPVRAALVQKPGEYRWSTAAAHRAGREDDLLVRVAPFRQLVANWESFLSEAPDGEEVRRLKKHERTGRPLGNPSFVGEESLGRTLRTQAPGPRKKK